MLAALATETKPWPTEAHSPKSLLFQLSPRQAGGRGPQAR
jgi:hypothetical protein